MRVLYAFAIFLYGAAIKLAAWGNPKARLWLSGRNNWRNQLRLKRTAGDWIWFHAASLGEHESLKPIMETIKKEHPDFKLLLTFFSPSGYEVRKNDPIADYVCYLPLDTIRNAKDFVGILRPRMAIFARYEFWLNYMEALQNQNIPHIITAATFRKGQFVTSRLAGFIRKRMKKLSAIFVQNSESLELLKALGFENARFSGDTRIDRVVAISQAPVDYPLIEAFCKGEKVFIAGSSWRADEASFLPGWQTHGPSKMIIAPHIVSEENLQRLESTLIAKSIRWSKAEASTIADYKVLIVDNIGHLSKLYRYGFMAFVGGGNTTGIHNILEAAVYGLPVCFGPKHDAFPEAAALIKAGGGFSVNSPEDFDAVYKRLSYNRAALQKASSACLAYIHQQQGATSRIMQHLTALLRT
jgi:3-deoxy-D-manno-octulosonic-acid transferase